MGFLILRAAAGLVTAVLIATAAPAIAGDNAGATLVQKNGCQGCHGSNFQGMNGFPALYGIEHRRTRDQIVEAIVRPKAPMPNFGFTPSQAGDIADYLAGLDGGSAGSRPTIIVTPAHPQGRATVTVRFPGAAPQRVEVVPSMTMGGSAMASPAVELKRSPDGHTFVGTVPFGMGGSWTLRVKYNGQEIDRPIAVGQ